MKRSTAPRGCEAAIVEAVAQPVPAPPAWLPEAVLTLRHWHEGGLLRAVQQAVQVARGRMGHFETCDFVLVLLVHALSGERTLASLFRGLPPCRSALAALWQRARLPSASALSRFLAAVPATALDALRAVLLDDLCAHGIAAAQMGGLVDREGVRHLVFDVDGTKQVARQRRVVATPAHPAARRRLVPLCAPGYAGRKRGQVLRTRTAIQQAHTHEWLGTFGHAGNGEAFAELECACAAAGRYLRARGLEPRAGVLRLDGLYGFARYAWTIARAGLGYLVRCCDYRLLERPEIRAQLAVPSAVRFVQPDTGTVRTVYDLGVIAWTAGADPTMRVATRLVATAHPATAAAPAVGHRIGDVVYELFATDRTAPGWSALDVLSLYAARGGFEQTLAEEDREQDPDRWCSAHAHGQEVWQVLCQWVWNHRLRLGLAAQAPTVRRTLWAPAAADAAIDLSTDAPRTPVASAVRVDVDVVAAGAAVDVGEIRAPPEPPSEPEIAIAPHVLPSVAAPVVASGGLAFGQIAPASGRGKGCFGGSDFTWQADGTLRCPAGKTLYPAEHRVRVHADRVVYAARRRDCATCVLAARCRGHATPSSSPNGRTVSVVRLDVTAERRARAARDALPRAPIVRRPPPPVPPPPTLPATPAPVVWEDVPATALRRAVYEPLRRQRVEIAASPPPPPCAAQAPAMYTRAQRAHRRCTWNERLARNARPLTWPPWRIRVFGVPLAVSDYLARFQRRSAA